MYVDATPQNNGGLPPSCRVRYEHHDQAVGSSVAQLLL